MRIDRRFAEILGGIGLLVLAASIGDSGMSWLPAIGGLYLLLRQFSQTNNSMQGQSQRTWRSESYGEERQPRMVTDAPTGTQIYAHALDAVQAAGIDPSETPVLPVDVGVMGFKDEQPPALFRTQPVFDDVDAIQPFVQLRLATRATGKIRFEVLDADGQVVFVHEDFHNLKAGLNLISPSARLRLHPGHAMHRRWQIRISADGILIAQHGFDWAENPDKIIRRHVQVDGELSPEIRKMLEDSPAERVSLDDLLAEQPADEKQQAARR
jgi:hypothetical protein